MMKAAYVVNLAVAGVLLIPAVALQGGESHSLEESLRGTVAALEEFTQVNQRLESGDPTAKLDLLRLTEAPALDARTRDERREVLRDELNRLQVALDEFDPSLAGERAPVARPSPIESEPVRGQAPVAFEPHGYVADSARLGRAFFRQERFAEALAILEPVRGDAQAYYWKGRCLERLDRGEEALASYLESEQSASDPRDAERAKEAREFLEWRRRFERTAAKEGARP